MMIHFEQVVERLSKWFSWISGTALTAMMVLVCLNVVLRIMYQPILGTYEIVGFLGAVVVSFGLAYTTVKQGHVAVDLLVMTFSPRAREATHSFTSFLSVLLFALIAWRSFAYGMELMRFGHLSQTLKIPFHPLVFGLALSSALTSLALLVELLKSLSGVVRS